MPVHVAADQEPNIQRLFVTLWGVWDPFSGASLDATLDRIVAHGYQGVEMPIAFAMKYGSAAFLSALKSRGLKYIAGVYSSGPAPTPGNMGIESQHSIVHLPDSQATRDVERHQMVFEAQLQEVLHFKSVLQSVTCHTGKDYFSGAEADQLFSFCTSLTDSLGLNGLVHHETHRSRILYSPWVISDVLARHPALTLVADLSHYTCVAEACDDIELNRVITHVVNPRVRHVHARVGHEQGPQVPDPRGSRWQPYLRHFKSWWADIYSKSLAAGYQVSATPEFGPIPYCWSTPFDDQPLADMWEVNHYMAHELAALYKDAAGDSGIAAPLQLPVEAQRQ